MTFTKTELEILLHRAELADCLGEVYAHTLFADKSQEEFNRAIEEGEKAAEEVLRLLREGKLDLTTLTPIQKFVVQDWIDGSTFFAGIDDAIASGELTHQRASAQRRAGEALVEKFRAVGLNVTMPQL